MIGLLDLAKSADQCWIDNEFLLTGAVFHCDILIAQVGKDRPHTTTRLGVAGIEGGIQLGAKIHGFSIVSGGAKEVDTASEEEGLVQDGPVVEFPVEGLSNCLSNNEIREAVLDDTLTIASMYRPDASWSVGGAMGRNKLIHGFSEYTIVVRSGDETGGTWEGATENLSHN